MNFWNGKKVFITGHTGFKGSWLCLWLSQQGAHVTGYALDSLTEPSLYKLARLDELVDSRIADIRDAACLERVMGEVRPEIVIHLAAQPLVRDSYKIPVKTYAVNVMGTIHLLEAVRGCSSVRAIVNVTTDKCYENREWVWGYREDEPMGGFDPYSSSKACSELVTSAYRSSFFHADRYAEHGVGLASARAGNVIGGGDWAADRLIPDCLKALLAGEVIRIRNPRAIRPWQHVLEPLAGYLRLARLLYEQGPKFAEGWNFGPLEDEARSVEWIVKQLCCQWDKTASYVIDEGDHPHEAHYLKLDCSKARMRLGWQPLWSLTKALESVVEWFSAYQAGEDIRKISLQQIDRYEMDSALVRGATL